MNTGQLRPVLGKLGGQRWLVGGFPLSASGWLVAKGRGRRFSAVVALFGYAASLGRGSVVVDG